MHPDGRAQNFFSVTYLLQIGLIAAVYFFAAKFGLSLAFATQQVSTVWPPTGIALAIILLWGPRVWPGIAIGAFAINFLTNEPFLVACGIALGNTLEAIVGSYLLTRIAGFRTTMERIKDVLALIVFASFFSTMISATIGVSSLALGHIIPWTGIGSVWIVWWLGDLVGALVMTPVILAWAQNIKDKITPARIAEGGALLAGITIVSILVFTNSVSNIFLHYPLESAVFPFLIWAALRFGPRGTASATLIISAIAIWGAIYGMGPLSPGLQFEQGLLLLQFFTSMTAITSLMLAAATAERKKNAQDLETNKTIIEEKEARDEALLDSIGEGVIAMNDKGEIILMNTHAKALLGRETNHIVGKALAETIRMEYEDGTPVPVSERPIIKAMTSAQKITSLPHTAYYYVRRDGSRFPSAIIVNPIYLKQKILGVIEIFRDITKEWEIDRAKSEFVSLASHQLRTPLTLISWHAERLHHKAQTLTPDELRYVEEIRHATGRMVQLVNTLLNISRIELGTFAVERENINIISLADEVIHELAPDIQNKKISFTTRYKITSQKLSLDPTIIRTVFQNIISNAVHYTPSGGRISLDLREEKDSIAIRIQDNGYGIPKQDQAKIFTKLFRSDTARRERSEGTGLGLYIIKSMIEKLGGSISFVSQENEGTTFTILIPLRIAREQDKKHSTA